MVCPFCNNKDTSVFNSRPTSRLNNVWRRRRCESCNKTFTTNETVDPSSVLTVKNGKTKEKFIVSTLLISIMRVLDHLDDSNEVAQYITQTVLQKLYRKALGSAQVINKADISLCVLATLKNYNLAAYVKYLSYHSPNIDSRSLNKKIKESSTF